MLQKAIKIAWQEALNSYKRDEIPTGAVIFNDNEILASSGNYVEEHHSILSHAELQVIKSASQRVNNHRLNGYSMLSTLEPCCMCSGAIIHARITKVYFLASENKLPGLEQVISLQGHNHIVKFEKLSLKDYDSSKLLKSFFQEKRKNI